MVRRRFDGAARSLAAAADCRAALGFHPDAVGSRSGRKEKFPRRPELSAEARGNVCRRTVGYGRGTPRYPALASRSPEADPRHRGCDPNRGGCAERSKSRSTETAARRAASQTRTEALHGQAASDQTRTRSALELAESCICPCLGTHCPFTTRPLPSILRSIGSPRNRRQQ